MRNVIIGSGVYGLSTAIELIIEGMDVIIIDSNNEDIASRNALGRIDPIFKGSGSYVATKDNNSAQRPKDQRQFALKSFNLHIEYYEKYYKGTKHEYEFNNIPTLQVLNQNDLNERNEVFKKMNDIIEEKSVLVPLYYDEVYRFYSNDLSDFKTNSFNALLLKEAKKNIK